MLLQLTTKSTRELHTKKSGEEPPEPPDESSNNNSSSKAPGGVAKSTAIIVQMPGRVRDIKEQGEVDIADGEDVPVAQTA